MDSLVKEGTSIFQSNYSIGIVPWGVIKTDKRLLEIFVGWEEKLDNDEWYFSNSFESITKGMSPEGGTKLT